MSQQLLKITGSACLIFLFHASGFAQEDTMTDHDTDKGNNYNEIIIRHKGDKDAKMTVEIKDGEVFINGKPVQDFADSTISIRKLQFNSRGDNNFSFSGPGVLDLENLGDQVTASLSPFRTWSYGSDTRSNKPFLGVASEKPSDSEGARVIEISKGSAAEKSGLRPGDVITKINDEDVIDPSSLTDAVRKHEAGDKIAITFSRDGKVMKDSAKLGKSKAVTANAYFTPYANRSFDVRPYMPRGFDQVYGLNNPLKFGIRAQDTEDGKGVKVLDVDDESTAAKAGIKEGDIITRFDGKEINSATALTEAAHAAKDKVSVKISLIRDGKTQEVEVHVPKRLRTADL